MLEGFVPFPPEFGERYRKKGYWLGKSLASFFEEVFARYADRVAMSAGDERVTYRQLAERAERLALHLVRLGIRPLDRVVMQLPNVPEFVYLYFALQKVGAIPIMALPAHRYLEISHFIRLSDAVSYAVPTAMGDFNFIELAEKIGQESSTLRCVLVYGDDVPAGFIPLKELLQTDSGLTADALKPAALDPTRPAVFQLSGGTTGVPKLIPRTHNDYIYNSKASAAVIDIRPDDALLVVLPIAHNFPLASPGIQGFLMHGARIVLAASTRAADAFPIIEREQITHLELVPALLIRWINDPAIKGHDLSCVHIINTGGQKLQPEVKRRTEELIRNCTVQEVFGMAEGLLCYVRLDDPADVRMQTVGRPICPDDEIKLVDDAGREVPPGEIGELIVRGPYTLRGYFRAPDHNARAFTPDGFYRTGDLMRQHLSGSLVVEGRKKDLINRGGEKISAEEVENLILSHPAVHNVACVPMPDPVLGERMCAYVVPRSGSSITLNELTDFLMGKGLAKFKLPERLELLNELPVSGFGKVSKKTLIEWIAAKVKEETGL